MNKWILLTILSAFFAVACTGGGGGGVGTQTPLDAVLIKSNLNNNLYIDLKAGEDVAHLMGRFIPKDATQNMSSSIAKQSKCSAYIRHKTSKTDVEYDEIFMTSVSGSIGGGDLQGLFTLDAKAASRSLVRIKYHLTKVTDAIIADQDGFNACCTESPTQCEGLYIGRFIYGSGQIFKSIGQEGEFKGGTSEIIKLGMEADWGLAWKSSTSFKDTYFGFELTPLVTEPDFCSDSRWKKGTVPEDKTGKGEYFIGISPKAMSEKDANIGAERDARGQAVRYLFGEYLSQSGEQSSGSTEALTKDVNIMRYASEGVIDKLKVKCFDAKKIPATPQSFYQSRALVYIRTDQRKEASLSMIDSILGKISADDERRTYLKTMRDQVSDTE